LFEDDAVEEENELPKINFEKIKVTILMGKFRFLKSDFIGLKKTHQPKFLDKKNFFSCQAALMKSQQQIEREKEKKK
jgi:hypothetical protein